MMPDTRSRSGCPLCGRPAAAPHAPFCSRGCRDRDLVAWLSDDYRLPGRDPAPDGLDSAGDAD